MNIEDKSIILVNEQKMHRVRTGDISDYQVLKAYEESKRHGLFKKFPYDILMERTGACEKVCYRAMERAYDRDLIEYGVSLRSGWITEKGYTLMSEHDHCRKKV